MKKCEFCGKEISYHEQYCTEKCENDAKAFYKKRSAFAKISSALTVVSLSGFGIGAFMFLFGIGWASVVVSACIAMFGVLLILFPYGTDYMIKKYAVQKSALIMRSIGIVICVVGSVFIFAALMYILR